MLSNVYYFGPWYNPGPCVEKLWPIKPEFEWACPGEDPFLCKIMTEDMLGLGDILVWGGITMPPAAPKGPIVYMELNPEPIWWCICADPSNPSPELPVGLWSCCWPKLRWWNIWLPSPWPWGWLWYKSLSWWLCDKLELLEIGEGIVDAEE